MRVTVKGSFISLFALTMGRCLHLIFLFLLLVALLSAVHGMPSPLNWGPASNRGPGGGPGWNGGDTTDNIILHSGKTGKWRY
ncbi:uncharacterized protein LOC117784053 [Drosophila innubila]|uniref:uncharacterized protein LOC117784053 n=1 Tax=Drosophila innubila TaxID=198719 RepID=UPI00148DDC3E|nr:uncharacterized protein LOC117784053 [Drosophila innubila]